jgi:hypothetical protein
LEPSEEVLQALNGCLSDSNRKISDATMDIISQMGAKAETMYSTLIEMLTQGKQVAKILNILTRDAQKPELREQVEPLATKSLASPDPNVRRSASGYLAKCEKVGDQAVEALTKALSDSDVLVRMHTIEALFPHKDETGVKDAFDRRLKDEKHPQVLLMLKAAVQ